MVRSCTQGLGPVGDADVRAWANDGDLAGSFSVRPRARRSLRRAGLPPSIVWRGRFVATRAD